MAPGPTRSPKSFLQKKVVPKMEAHRLSKKNGYQNVSWCVMFGPMAGGPFHEFNTFSICKMFGSAAQSLARTRPREPETLKGHQRSQDIWETDWKNTML